MNCPICKGSIPSNFKGQTCPSCGEALPRTQSIITEWAIRAAAFSEDRGYFFWLLICLLTVFLLASLEHLFGNGDLLLLLDQHKFIGMITLFYSAAFLQIVRNINTVNRPGYPGPYWTDRLIIKRFKRGTNFSLVIGFITSLIVLGPFDIFRLLPAYVIIVSLFPAIFWSIASFRIDDREFLDAKVISYFNFLGVRRLRTWRKTSGALMLGMIIAAALFFSLLHIPGLWWMLKENPVLNGIISIFSDLFGWVPQLMPAG